MHKLIVGVSILVLAQGSKKHDGFVYVVRVRKSLLTFVINIGQVEVNGIDVVFFIILESGNLLQGPVFR